jgi:hypothetical protein
MDCLVRARPGVYDFRRAAQIKTSVQVVEQASAALGIVPYDITRREGGSTKRDFIFSTM